MSHDDAVYIPPAATALGKAFEALLYDQATIPQMELIRDDLHIRKVINDDDGVTFKSFIVDNTEPEFSDIFNALRAFAEHLHIHFNGNEFYMGTSRARDFLINPGEYVAIRKASGAMLRGLASDAQLDMLSDVVNIEKTATPDGAATTFKMRVIAKPQINHATEAEAEAAISYSLSEAGVKSALEDGLKDATNQPGAPQPKWVAGSGRVADSGRVTDSGEIIVDVPCNERPSPKRPAPPSEPRPAAGTHSTRAAHRSTRPNKIQL